MTSFLLEVLYLCVFWLGGGMEYIVSMATEHQENP